MRALGKLWLPGGGQAPGLPWMSDFLTYQRLMSSRERDPQSPWLQVSVQLHINMEKVADGFPRHLLLNKRLGDRKRKAI